MAVNSENQLKFDEGKTTEPLTILGCKMEELEFGSKYVVSIKQTIEGYDHFLPSPGLEKKMKEENIDVNDTITIEKVPKSEKYPYGYFTINVVEKAKKIEDHPMGAGFAQKDTKELSSEKRNEARFPANKLDIHEISIRLEKVEEMVSVLSSEAGHKPGDEKLPF